MRSGYGTNPDTRNDIIRLEHQMVAKYGIVDQKRREAFGDEYYYTHHLDALQPMIDNHPNWHMKRMDQNRWEVRNGLKDKSYYGKTLAIAICKALLEVP